MSTIQNFLTRKTTWLKDNPYETVLIVTAFVAIAGLAIFSVNCVLGNKDELAGPFIMTIGMFTHSLAWIIAID